MPKSVVMYDLLISCPGDVKEELSLIESAVTMFNELYADYLGITIRSRHWRKSSYAQSGGKPQALLNEQFADECDAAVAIFWTRFGSPTDDYGSGTEEEIERMLKSGKQVFMYFSDKPISPSQMNEDGYKKIQAFRDKYKDRGLYFTYSSDEDFKQMFFAHLSSYFIADQRVKEIKASHSSQLRLMGINVDGKLSDDASVYPFTINTNTTMDQYIDRIRATYQEISQMHVGKRSPVDKSIFVSLTNPVDINDEEKEFLTAAAEQLKIDLPGDFFDVGNLSKDSLPTSLYGGVKLNGTFEEKSKYRTIQKLHEIIDKALEWAPIEKAFSDKKCLRLAVQNRGKTIDEDVEITLEIPKSTLLTLDEFPCFSNDEMGYLINDCEMSVLFGIDSTAEYVEYDESIKSDGNKHAPRIWGLPGYTPNYSDGFVEELNDVFCYSIYLNDDNYIVKLKVDYIKHNTSVAFPSVLFVKNEISEIPYRITSRNNPDIVEGILKIQGS